jgi:hypothetical protein
MTYNPKIYHEQGGSVFRITSTGSLVVESGGQLNINNATLELGAGTVTQASGGAFNASGSITVVVGAGALFIGNAQALYGASSTGPAGLPVSASPGSIFFRSDGSVSNIYINVSTGTAGSVWKSACIVD